MDHLTKHEEYFRNSCKNHGFYFKTPKNEYLFKNISTVSVENKKNKRLKNKLFIDFPTEIVSILGKNRGFF